MVFEAYAGPVEGSCPAAVTPHNGLSEGEGAPLKVLGIFVGMALMGGALAAVLLYQGIVRFNYPSQQAFPVQGVDVSHHQKDIHWELLRGEGVQFAYIKATEGATFRDPQFVSNWKAALEVGIVPGAYHFFTLCKGGEEQANNFINALREVQGSGLPPAVDLEFGGNCGARPTPQQLKVQLHVFLETLWSVAPCPPVLYVTEEFYHPYIAGQFPDALLWARNIFTRPRLQAQDQWIFWQFANRGRLPGVSTFIDLNVFNGSPERFSAFRCTVSSPGTRLEQPVPSDAE